MDTQLLTAAREWYDAGYCVVPSHEDGGKRPFGAWKQYQAQRPTWKQVEAWLASGRYSGIGVLTGATSGNVEMLELEGPMDAAVERLGKVAAKARDYAEVGMPDLLTRIASGCVEQSAGGGLHLFIRVTDGPAMGNTKLAMSGGKVVSETRGEGGFVIVAPTPARNGHPEGASYLFINGGHPAKTVEVTSEDRDMLHLLFTLALDEDDQEPAKPAPPKDAPTVSAALDGPSALDAYRATPWADILTPAGWTWSHHDGERDHWTRPGKPVTDGTSATTIEDGPLFCFSTSVDLPTEVGLSKGQVYAHLHHGGDMSAASRALAAAGYGSGVTYADLPAWAVPANTIPSPATPSTPSTAAAVDHDAEPDPYTSAVQRKYAELRVLDDAKAMLATAKAGQAPPLEPISLSEFLNQPDEDERYRIAGLWPAEGRVLLAAAAKSGKTTIVVANLIPSLVDGRPFLGSREAQPVTGTVAYLNMEVGDRTMRHWMRDAGIAATDKVSVLNLRGKASALSLGTEAGRARLARTLRDLNTEVAILDPLAPVLASLGLDENSNADVALFFSWWSDVLAQAGVRDDVVVHHAGHAGQRSRGASRLLDEPDAVWTLTKDAEGDDDAEFSALTPTRYLTAYGRDVDMAPEALAFDPATRALTLTGMGRAEVSGDAIERRVRRLMADGKARTVSAIKKETKGGSDEKWAAIASLISSKDLLECGKTQNGYPLYILSEAVDGA